MTVWEKSELLHFQKIRRGFDLPWVHMALPLHSWLRPNRGYCLYLSDLHQFQLIILISMWKCSFSRTKHPTGIEFDGTNLLLAALIDRGGGISGVMK